MMSRNVAGESSAWEERTRKPETVRRREGGIFPAEAAEGEEQTVRRGARIPPLPWHPFKLAAASAVPLRVLSGKVSPFASSPNFRAFAFCIAAVLAAAALAMASRDEVLAVKAGAGGPNPRPPSGGGGGVGRGGTRGAGG